MKKNGWKITAIIFIVLFIAESLAVVYLWKLGSDWVKADNECALVVCEGYDAFSYEDYGKICTCYRDNEVAHTEIME